MSTETKFTPGPWRAIHKSRPIGWADWEIAWSDDGELVCDIVYQQADAHLIAAAPDLYAALESMVNAIGEADEIAAHAEAIAALAKARGES